MRRSFRKCSYRLCFICLNGSRKNKFLYYFNTFFFNKLSLKYRSTAHIKKNYKSVYNFDAPNNFLLGIEDPPVPLSATLLSVIKTLQQLVKNVKLNVKKKCI